ncbi:MAG: SIR2 family protein [bacterium]
MKIANIDFPNPLLDALRDNRLVIFAGSGVSMGEPANLPDFRGLAIRIAEGTGETIQENEPVDRFLGRLKFKNVEVHSLAAKVLSYEGLEPTDLHRQILRLFVDLANVRIVTTNYDRLFEKAFIDIFSTAAEVFTKPILPPGDNFKGIVHLHGAITTPHEMVLTDEDFGRAYLTDGGASRFLVSLFQHFTVLFVGYSHNDTIVSYLARALPETEVGRRFALTGEDEDQQKWQVLGIKPIVFQKSSDHDFSALYEGVRDLANTVSRSILDWQREITTIATNPPPLSEEESGIIDYALQDVAKTRFFTDVSRLPDWILWLDRRKYFEPLFSYEVLCERDLILARWLAEHYALPHSDYLFLLISKHGNRIYPDFWREIVNGITLKKQGLINDNILSRWISLLLSTIPPDVSSIHLYNLGELCVEKGAMTDLLQIFDAMSECCVWLKEGIKWSDDDKDDPSPKINFELQFVGEQCWLNDLWEKGLKPKLAQVAEPLLELIVRHLEQQHFTLRVWQKADHEWNAIGSRRSAIEPHEQDKHPNAIDVLIDAARDCLEWMVVNQPQYTAYWCDLNSNSETPLIRRLVVHVLAARTDLTADERVN